MCLMLPRKEQVLIYLMISNEYKKNKNYLPGFESQGLSHKINLKEVGDTILFQKVISKVTSWRA